MLPGVRVKHEDLDRTPLWHKKLFEFGGSTRACNPIIAKGTVLISQVVNFSLDSPDFSIPPDWKKPLLMTPFDQLSYEISLRKIQKAYRLGLGVEKKWACFEPSVMVSPLSMSLCTSMGSKQEARQPRVVWQALQKVHLPGMDKDFVRQALWGKLSVASRIHFIFPNLPQWCPLDFAVEDHHHRLKSCTFLQLPCHILRDCLPVVRKEGRVVEFGRLCWDEPALSLTTPQGLLMWKVIGTLWIYRCAVMFKGEQVNLIPFMAMLRDGLKWWLKEENLAVPVALVSRFVSSVEKWLMNEPYQVLSVPNEMVKMDQWQKSGREKSQTPP